jgi:hypothetical protein
LCSDWAACPKPSSSTTDAKTAQCSSEVFAKNSPGIDSINRSVGFENRAF